MVLFARGSGRGKGRDCDEYLHVQLRDGDKQQSRQNSKLRQVSKDLASVVITFRDEVCM